MDAFADGVDVDLLDDGRDDGRSDGGDVCADSRSCEVIGDDGVVLVVIVAGERRGVLLDEDGGAGDVDAVGGLLGAVVVGILR